MTSNSTTYYSNGKLLLSGEYVVLDGALSLALPSIYGQYLTVAETNTQKIIWKSLDMHENTWFKTVIGINSLKDVSYTHLSEGTETTSDTKTNQILLRILAAAQKLNPAFLNTAKSYEITTKLTFPKDWGLGSSSTLINNIAQWAKVDAYKLLYHSFSGSGYDIACAQHPQPIMYRLNGKTPIVKPFVFSPSFAAQLYFVYRNKKQDSREGIRRYQAVKKDKANIIKAISNITEKIALTQNLDAFEVLIEAHEQLISDLIKLPKIKDMLFPDYFGSVKSLGAWGGDFILATGNENTPVYFKNKGFTTVLPYKDMVLQSR